MAKNLLHGNRNAAYLQVKRNGRAAGIDRICCKRLAAYLTEHVVELREYSSTAHRYYFTE